jgi:putative nucleotidyltransferase with HDIG domain
MNRLEGKDFFDNIRRSVKISHFVSSIIPLSLLTYFSIRYVIPYVTAGNASEVPLSIGIVLVLSVAVSILGLLLSVKATNSSITSAQDLNLKLNSLFEITKQFRETVYPDILLEKILRSAMELIQVESGSLLLRDDDGNFQFKVHVGKNSEKYVNKFVKPGEGVAGWVAENGKPALINDVSKDNRYSAESDTAYGVAARSILCVPLILSNEIIGVIELRNKMNGIFTKQNDALLHGLADQASISIMQNRSNERNHSDLIHITEILVSAQDYVQNRKEHARMVAKYAILIGKQLDLPESDLKKLYYAALLHDIGMLRIDAAEQLQKEKIMQHPKLGYDLVKSISLWTDSADIILHHHERYDGKGYPMSKERDEIPVGARILSVADAFDVLTNGYSYKQFDHASALKEIEAHSGTQFDPTVVEAFRASLSNTGIQKED